MDDLRDAQIKELQLQVRGLAQANDQLGLQLRAAEDRCEALERTNRDGWKEEIGRREKRIAELEGQLAAQTKIVHIRENEVRAREDRINELNVEVTALGQRIAELNVKLGAA